jgi:hypothetical protein
MLTTTGHAAADAPVAAYLVNATRLAYEDDDVKDDDEDDDDKGTMTRTRARTATLD